MLVEVEQIIVNPSIVKGGGFEAGKRVVEVEQIIVVLRLLMDGGLRSGRVVAGAAGSPSRRPHDTSINKAFSLWMLWGSGTLARMRDVGFGVVG
jgi:hypothetical protein